MKKKRANLSTFFTTSPLQTAFGILVILSALINLGALLFVVLLQNTASFDMALESYTMNKLCRADYTGNLAAVAASSTKPADSKKFFAAAACFRDYKSGKPIDINSLQPIK